MSLFKLFVGAAPLASAALLKTAEVAKNDDEIGPTPRAAAQPAAQYFYMDEDEVEEVNELDELEQGPQHFSLTDIFDTYESGFDTFSAASQSDAVASPSDSLKNWYSGEVEAAPIEQIGDDIHSEADTEIINDLEADAAKILQKAVGNAIDSLADNNDTNDKVEVEVEVEPECAICFCPITEVVRTFQCGDRTLVKRLPCGHFFHLEEVLAPEPEELVPTAEESDEFAVMDEETRQNLIQQIMVQQFVEEEIRQYLIQQIMMQQFIDSLRAMSLQIMVQQFVEEEIHQYLIQQIMMQQFVDSLRAMSILDMMFRKAYRTTDDNETSVVVPATEPNKPSNTQNVATKPINTDTATTNGTFGQPTFPGPEVIQPCVDNHTSVVVPVIQPSVDNYTSVVVPATERNSTSSNTQNVTTEPNTGTATKSNNGTFDLPTPIGRPEVLGGYLAKRG